MKLAPQILVLLTNILDRPTYTFAKNNNQQTSLMNIVKVSVMALE